MTPENKSTIYWTTGAMAAIAAVLAVLWFLGIFQTAAVQ